MVDVEELRKPEGSFLVDVHAHLGWDQVFEHRFGRDELVEVQREWGIDVTLVQPASCHTLEDVRRQHDEVARLADDFPGRFYGMANPNPHLPASDYREELFRCVRRLGFVGVKLHPNAHSLSPASEEGRRVFRLAAELGVPVMVHTGNGIPAALPTKVASPAAAFPEVPIILAHSGMMIFSEEALQVAREYENVYLEVSWTPSFLVREFVEEIGADRVLFGSDHADNVPTELTKLKSAGLGEEELQRILGGTAAEIYDLEDRERKEVPE